MTTIILLAGGKSTRMGRDKSMMKGGVNRLFEICNSLGQFRIITLCGDESRISLFSGEVWADPIELNGSFEIIKWCLSKIDDDVQFIPCDAFNLHKEGIAKLLKISDGIPTDEQNFRQPLFARITNRELFDVNARNLNDFFVNLPSITDISISKQYTNFNTKEDLKSL